MCTLLVPNLGFRVQGPEYRMSGLYSLRGCSGSKFKRAMSNLKGLLGE